SHIAPPGSTLLPYTTLFRSRDAGRARRRRQLNPPPVGAAAAATLACVRGAGGHSHPGPNAPPLLIESRLPPFLRRVFGGVGAGEDRKSTRLNSSHVKISYAV